MKKSVVIFVIFMTTLSIFGQSSITFEEIEYDFGTFENGSYPTLHHKFKFKNTGKEPIKIISAIASYKDIKVKYPDYVILPGKYDEIVVSVKTDYLKENFKKSITIRTDNYESTRLYIKGFCNNDGKREQYDLMRKKFDFDYYEDDQMCEMKSHENLSCQAMKLIFIKGDSITKNYWYFLRFELDDFCIEQSMSSWEKYMDKVGFVMFSNGEKIDVTFRCMPANFNYLLGYDGQIKMGVKIETQKVLDLFIKYNVDYIECEGKTFKLKLPTAPTIDAMYQRINMK